MNLKRQLLLVSVLTLVLPLAGYQFIRETESALRAGQQQMLAGTARAIADSLAQHPEEFPPKANGQPTGDQLYGQPLETRPEIDGYFDDWSLERSSLRSLRGTDGPIRFAIGLIDQAVYLYVEVSDRNVVFAQPGAIALDDGPRFADRVSLVNTSPLYLDEKLLFAAEAPGAIVAYVLDDYGFSSDPSILATWQDVPGGYQIEARIPLSKLGTHLGIVVSNTANQLEAPVRSTSFSAQTPGAFVTQSPELGSTLSNFAAQPGMRLFVTDSSGWRIASSGDLAATVAKPAGASSAWLRIAYDSLVEAGQAPELALPDPGGREQQDYIVAALAGEESSDWFRSAESGRAIVAVAQPVVASGEVIGALVLQQGTDAILSLTKQGLVRLMNVTLIATLLVAATLLGYATWLSRRIRRLSVAAEDALETDDLRSALPSATSGDEVGDLSRSFSHVLCQMGDYNDYLRTLASKLSHELRTPLAIVTSSLENLEHEPLNEASTGYAARARDGADRLRRILTAMSEASRVEELMQHAEPENFDLCAALRSTVAAYKDIYPKRSFTLEMHADSVIAQGSPELIVQMLDKLVDNAVGFSNDGDTIAFTLAANDNMLSLTVTNPGPPLPERMRYQMFDSMVSMRPGEDNKHLGLGLYVARLIAEGHGGKINAENTVDGVAVCITLPGDTHGE